MKKNQIDIDKKRITINQAIKEFPNYLYVKGKTKSTMKAYIGDLKIFREFMKDSFRTKYLIKEITRSDIVFYQTFLIDKVKEGIYKKVTADRKFDSLKVFYDYLEHYGHISDNFLKGFSFTRAKGSYDKENAELYIPEFLEPYDIDRIIQTAKNTKTSNSLRDICILELLRSTGCRRSSVLDLEWEDIHLFKGTILIKHQKTKNTSTVPLSQRLKIALVDYMKTQKSPSGHVFRSNKGNPLSKTAFTQVIKKYVELSDIQNEKNFEITAKTFRHSFITLLVRKNIPLEKIARYTGHKDVNTLKIYTHLKTEDLDDISSLVG
ncbi:MAG: tyrosine-type recombinase/integrase [Marinisporobacter sp.]|jgi:site-specific recombinase XerD|nr:tyrosine-type recombinase/integrase [Marinisporobacter sp.]